ncbi:MAG: hypothetical protein V7K18_06090 [Nostoc sp.]
MTTAIKKQEINSDVHDGLPRRATSTQQFHHSTHPTGFLKTESILENYFI